MAKPPFYLQLVDGEGTLVKTRCGGKQEVELVNQLMTGIQSTGHFGFWTQAQLRAGIVAALHGIKVTNPLDVIVEVVKP